MWADVSLYKDELHRSQLRMIRLVEKGRVKLSDVEVGVVAELMRNSRRSDREIAKAVGVSQPTVSRTIAKLEKKGVIKEYTMIPDFTKLGYNILGATLLGVQEPASGEKFQEVRKEDTKIEEMVQCATLLAVHGLGGDKNRLFMNFYESYSDYADVMKLTKQIPNANIDSIESLLVDLSDRTNVRQLSMSTIAKHLLQRPKRMKSRGQNEKKE